MMRVLVTGAGGFVGRHLVNLMRDTKYDVLATSASAGDGIERMDVTDSAEVSKVIGEFGPDCIIHLAARASVPASWQDPESTFLVNVIGTSHVLESARSYPDTRVLLIGSAQQYASAPEGRFLKETDPLKARSPYAVSKIAQEMLGRLYFEEFNFLTVMTRSFNHTGPGQARDYAVGSFASQIASFDSEHRTIEVGNLDSVRDFLDVRDVVRAYLLLLERGVPGEVYNICSGVRVRIGDLLKKMIELAGVESQIEVVEDSSGRRGDPDVLVGDNSKIRSLGWRPEISLDRSLADTLDWYRKGSHGI